MLQHLPVCLTSWCNQRKMAVFYFSLKLFSFCIWALYRMPFTLFIQCVCFFFFSFFKQVAYFIQSAWSIFATVFFFIIPSPWGSLLQISLASIHLLDWPSLSNWWPTLFVGLSVYYLFTIFLVCLVVCLFPWNSIVYAVFVIFTNLWSQNFPQKIITITRTHFKKWSKFNKW